MISLVLWVHKSKTMSSLHRNELAHFSEHVRKKQSKSSCVWDFIDVAQNFYNICVFEVNILIYVDLANIMSWRIFLIMLKLMLNQTLSAKLRLLLS